LYLEKKYPPLKSLREHLVCDSEAAVYSASQYKYCTK
jgi:hypothetical protein